MDVEHAAKDANPERSYSIRVLLADDHPVVRKALRSEINNEANLQVIAEASDGETAVKLVEELAPDVVIMDIGMPGMNGIEATQQIKTANPNVIVLVLSVYDDVEHVLGILKSGADGYLTKDILVEDIVQSIRSVYAGETVLSPHIFRQVLKYALRHSTKPLHMEDGIKLTPRELEILRLVAKGMGNKEIAQELDLGIRTVKGHLVDLFSKLKIYSRTEAVIAGLRAGFLKYEELE